jgi:hypothetical protein
MRTFTLACGWMMVLFAGCVPVSDGFRHELPRKDTLTVVWGRRCERCRHGDDLAAETRAVGSQTEFLVREPD